MNSLLGKKKDRGGRTRYLPVLVWAAFVVLLAAVACSRVAVDRNPRGSATAGLFRHRWWNYYARALAAADDRRYSDAEADLAAALAASDRDRRMARTYGMHFIDYFPHRELGIVYWLSGDLQAALSELEYSIAQYPTAKARFYLDEVRGALIRQRGDAKAPPVLTLDMSHSDNQEGDLIRTRDDPIMIRGQAVDPDYVSALRIMGQNVFLEGSRRQVAFEHPLHLTAGRHEIDIEADNLAGLTGRRRLTLVVDRAGPVVVLERLADTGTGRVLEGVVLDEAGVAGIEINGQAIVVSGGVPAAVSGAVEVPFVHRLARNESSTVITCRDILGNRTVARVDEGVYPVATVSSKLVAGLQLAGVFDLFKRQADHQGPELSLDDWQLQQTVYLDNVVLSGYVRDPDGVVSLTINKQAVLPRSGALIFFSRIVHLDPGANTITLAARDSRGNRTLRQIEIERRLPAALLLEHRLRLGILPFDQKGEVSPAGHAFQDSFMHQMTRPERFQVVERQHLDLILQEHKISRSRLVDTDTAVRLGRLAAAQAVVAGSLVQTRTGIEIVGRVVDSETSEVLATVDTYSEAGDLAGFKAMAQTLSLKIHREFPLSDGRVLEKNGDFITTSLGDPQLRAQRRILVYTEKPVRDPVTQKELGSEHQVLGAARVTQVQENFSKARVQEGGDTAITIRHKVIPQ